MQKISKHILSELRTIVGNGHVIADPQALISYSYDSQPVSARPDITVSVANETEIRAVLALAKRAGIPIVARGAGSGMTGGSVPEAGGIVLNLERMNRIIEISTEDSIGRVQPGVITAVFQQAAAKNGLFYPPEPASSQFSSLGGNVAESAGGLGCVKYGLTKQFVAGLRFLTADGDLVETGIYSDYDAPFDAGALLSGSEGTLGIILEIALRLIPLPESRVTMLALFKSLEEAAVASNTALMSGVGPSVLEFMDRGCIETVRQFADVEIPAETGALLIVEIDGDKSATAEGHEILRKALEALNPISLSSAKNEKERTELWRLRKSVSPATLKIAPLKFNEDICVPISKIPEICTYIEGLAAERDIKIVTFGHSGDGNLHVNFMTDWKRPDEIARVKEGIADLFRKAVRLGGTLSGEHGIGIAKRPFMDIALDKATMAWQKKIKRALDKDNILNPGKIFPD